MSHRTFVKGTGYEIGSGVTRVGGVAREIVQGRTSINGVGYDILFGIPLAEIDEGETVYIRENGVETAFYVAKHNYEDGLKDQETGLENHGRTLLVRKYLHSNRPWDTANNLNYANTSLDSWFNETYKLTLDPEVQDLVEKTVFRHTPYYGSSVTLSRSVFTLSPTELGIHGNASDTYNMPVVGSELPMASTLRFALFESEASETYPYRSFWSRTVHYRGIPMLVTPGISWSDVNTPSHENPVRPVFTLPGDTLFNPRTLEIKL